MPNNGCTYNLYEFMEDPEEHMATKWKEDPDFLVYGRYIRTPKGGQVSRYHTIPAFCFAA